MSRSQDIDELAGDISAHRYNCASEKELQDALQIVIAERDYDWAREVTLGPKDRIDFMTIGIGIEVKIKGAPNAVLRQLQRYAQYQQVEALLLVTTRWQLVRELPRKLNGKILSFVLMPGALR